MNVQEILVGVSAIVVPIVTYLSTRDKRNRVALDEVDEMADYLSLLLRWARQVRRILDEAGLEYPDMPTRKRARKEPESEEGSK